MQRATTLGRCRQYRSAIEMAAVILILIVQGGCDQPPQPGTSESAQTATGDVDSTASDGDRLRQWLQAVVGRYANQSHYRDRATVNFRHEGPAGQFSETTKLEVTFSRPKFTVNIERDGNRIRLLRDQRYLWARVDDETTNNFQHQVVQRTTPATSSIDQLYAATELLDPAQPQQMLNVMMGMPIGLQMSPIGFLLGDLEANKLIESAKEVRSLGATQFVAAAGARFECQRVAVQSSNGPFVFWVDNENVVRRIEFPTNNLFSHLAPNQRPTKISLTLDIESTSFAAESIGDTEFQWQLTGEPRLVQYFVLPPVTLASDKLGQKIAPMTFRQLVEGDTARRFSTDSVSDRRVVLLWFDQHPASQESLVRLSQFYRRSAKRNRPAVIAVCAASTELITDAQLANQQRELGIVIVRDEAAVGRDQLDVTQAPTLVVLDEQSRLQAYEVGSNPELAQTLTQLMGLLDAGQNVAARLRRGIEEQERLFQQQLNVASFGHSTAPPLRNEQVDVELPDPTAPKRASIKQAWQLTDIEQPGNLLMISQNGRKQLAVISGQQRVVLVDPEGGVSSKPIELGLEQDEFITTLRSSRPDQEAPEYVGFSQAGQYIYRFDQSLRLKNRFPDSNKRHTGVTDAQLVDLDGDGERELYVGFAPPLGCQSIDQRGRRRWSYRSAGGVSTIVARTDITPPHLLLAGGTGAIIPVGEDGTAGNPLPLGRRTVHQLHSSGSRTPRPSHFLGLSYTAQGRLIAIGLDKALQERWSYGLPKGIFRYQVTSPVWVHLNDKTIGHWLIVGPNGSLHIVQDDGRFNDSFRIGKHIAGAVGYRRPNGRGRLFISTQSTVTAYDYEQP